MPAFVHLNGILVEAAAARISLFDHGLLYGDGLFETLRVVNGRCFRPEAHLARLEVAARQLALPLPWPRSALRKALQETVAANGLETGAVRLTVTRGAGSPVPDPSVCEAPTYFITARSAPAVEPGQLERGLRLSVGPQHPRLFLPGVKSLCVLPYQLARTAARTAGYDDALLLWNDLVVETGISNLFVVQAGSLLTPGLDTGCLPGVTRALALELAQSLGIPYCETSVSLGALGRADELFVTNSVLGVMPVREVAEVAPNLPFGRITRALCTAYAEVVARETA